MLSAVTHWNENVAHGWKERKKKKKKKEREKKDTGRAAKWPTSDKMEEIREMGFFDREHCGNGRVTTPAIRGGCEPG